MFFLKYKVIFYYFCTLKNRYCTINIKMEKAITFYGDDVDLVRLAIMDKIMNINNAIKVNPQIKPSKSTLKRLEAYKELFNKMK